jgi:hypothetical protein
LILYFTIGKHWCRIKLSNNKYNGVVEEGIMAKVVSLKAKKYEMQYKVFYSKPENRNLQRSIWFKGDTVSKVKVV